MNENTTFRWQAIYLEPIIGSGEKIVIGFAICGPESVTEFIPTISNDVVKVIFKGRTKSFNRILDAIHRSVPSYVSDDRSILTEWVKPFEGVLVSSERTTIADNLDSAINQAIKLYSIFSTKIHDQNRYASSDHAEDSKNKKWINQLIKECEDQRSGVKHLFNRKLDSTEGVKLPNISVGFQSEGLVANFSHLSSRIISIKSKIIDLKIIKDAFKKKEFGLSRKVEMIVAVPENFEEFDFTRKQRSVTKDAWEQINDASDATEIPLIKVHSSTQAARHLVESI